MKVAVRETGEWVNTRRDDWGNSVSRMVPDRVYEQLGTILLKGERLGPVR
jgi:hypothetical protein